MQTNRTEMETRRNETRTAGASSVTLRARGRKFGNARKPIVAEIRMGRAEASGFRGGGTYRHPEITIGTVNAEGRIDSYSALHVCFTTQTNPQESDAIRTEERGFLALPGWVTTYSLSMTRADIDGTHARTQGSDQGSRTCRESIRDRSGPQHRTLVRRKR